PDAHLEWQLCALYSRIQLEANSPLENHMLQARISQLLDHPNPFRYLNRDPRIVPTEEWTPQSSTVMTVSACFLALSIVIDSTMRLKLHNWAHIATVAGPVWPRIMVWIPFIHPAYGLLVPHPSHIKPLVGIIFTMGHMWVRTPDLRQHTPLICRHAMSMWNSAAEQLSHDTTREAVIDTLETLTLLGVHVLALLSPAAAVQGMTCTPAVRKEIAHLLRGGTRSLYLAMLRQTSQLLERMPACEDAGASALRTYIKIVATLAREVLPIASHFPRTIKLAVDLIRRLPSNDLVAAACDLMLAMWTTAGNDEALVRSVRYGVVDALRFPHCHGRVHNIQVEALQYIVARTTYRSVLRELVAQGHASLGGAITRDVSRACEINAVLRSRSELMHESCVSMCAREEKKQWSAHRRTCLWKLYGLPGQLTYTLSALEAGFVVLQVFQHLYSKKMIVADLARMQKQTVLSGSGRDAIILEIFLDQLPPSHSVGRTARSSVSEES
ncbi:hypothetical protein BD626DRAFT_362560, partial [Schizophyllum amplum]